MTGALITWRRTFDPITFTFTQVIKLVHLARND
jgi:hypothetical protein